MGKGESLGSRVTSFSESYNGSVYVTAKKLLNLLRQAWLLLGWSKNMWESLK